MMCDKRSYTSVKHARAAHRHAGYRIRVYRCPECRTFHTTNQDKGYRKGAK